MPNDIHTKNQPARQPEVKEGAHPASKGEGAHEKKQGEEIKSRSADPGQSSYGGFSGEDTTKQAQDLDESGSEKSKP